MCGILGIVRRTYTGGASNADNTIIKDIFKSIFRKSQERGTDSSGMFILNKEYSTTEWDANKTKNVPVLQSHPLVAFNKAHIPAKMYVESAEYKDMLAYITSWTVSMVGHTRAATQGEPIDNKNNHPFRYGNIIGVHNGHILNWRELAKEYKLGIKGNCDSEVIFALIQQHIDRGASLSEAIKEMCEDAVGDLACAVAEITRPTELTLFRRGNPLEIRVVDKPYPTAIFASRDSYLTRAFESVRKETKGLKVMEWRQAILEDNTGVTLDTTKSPDEWVSGAFKFELS